MSSPTPRFKSISSSALSFLYGPILTSTHDSWKNKRFDFWRFYQSHVLLFTCWVNSLHGCVPLFLWIFHHFHSWAQCVFSSILKGIHFSSRICTPSRLGFTLSSWVSASYCSPRFVSIFLFYCLLSSSNIRQEDTSEFHLRPQLYKVKYYLEVISL